MSNHIRICIIYNNNVIFIRLDCINKLIAYFIRTHLRFQIICCNFRRFYKYSVFSFIRLFYPAVEEKGHMRIFFRLCNTSLFQTLCCKKLAKCVCNLFFYKSNQFIFDRNIVFCKTYIRCFHPFSSFKTVELIVAECSCDLSRAIRSEIEEDHRIPVFYCRCRSAVFHHYKRFHKLVSFLVVIRCLNSFKRRCRFNSFAFHQGIICFFHTIPTVVTIHRIITT